MLTYHFICATISKYITNVTFPHKEYLANLEIGKKAVNDRYNDFLDAE